MKLSKKSFFIVLVFFILIYILLLVINFKTAGEISCSEESKNYVVLAVCDGDTIVTEFMSSNKSGKNLCSYNAKLSPKQKKIRLLGLDAFEYKQNKYGPEAKGFLSMLVLNKQICIETDVEKKDIYGRTLGYVFIDEPVGSSAQIFINEELLKNGYAILYNFPPNIKYIDQLKKAQRYARQNMLGIWEESGYIKETPAQWRKKKLF